MINSSNGKTAQDLLDRVLLGRSDETKAKVLELVLRLGISPDDELFLVMIALNHLQVLIEDAPRDWQALFIDFQGELAEWSEINLDTLNSLIRKAENEQQLANISQSLVSALINSTDSWNKLASALEKSPLPSPSSKPTSPTPELLAQLQSVTQGQNQLKDQLTRQLHAMSQKLNVSVTLPAWLLMLLVALTTVNFFNAGSLHKLHERLDNKTIRAQEPALINSIKHNQ